ncbi:MAG: hypothetical protein U5R06_01480 [candidate division KSB1 bacterium]|nr:hypothetical protein [candidate division KSB1 bacterium]
MRRIVFKRQNTGYDPVNALVAVGVLAIGIWFIRINRGAGTFTMVAGGTQ